jgi:hypothetical protein
LSIAEELGNPFSGIGTRISNEYLSKVWISLEGRLLANKPMPKIDAFIIDEPALLKILAVSKVEVESLYLEYGSKLPPKVAAFCMPNIMFTNKDLADFLVFVRSGLDPELDFVVCLTYELLHIYGREGLSFD